MELVSKKSPGPGRTCAPVTGFCIARYSGQIQEADNMEWSFVFFLNSALLGVGLAMDAFSVSMANGLHDPRMSRETMCRIAGTFALFQAVMPMTGWVCVHTIVELFSSFEKFIPWIALALLGYIGGKMLVDGIKEPQKVEMALWKIIPPEEGSDLCHRFVMHGRAVCNARKPECEKCCLKDICRTAREAAGQQAEP